MNATSARFLRVAHVSTWTDRDRAHEEMVNKRLANLPGAVLSIDHNASVTDEGPLFSTLITYTEWRNPNDPDEENDEDASE